MNVSNAQYNISNRQLSEDAVKKVIINSQLMQHGLHRQIRTSSSCIFSNGKQGWWANRINACTELNYQANCLCSGSNLVLVVHCESLRCLRSSIFLEDIKDQRIFTNTDSNKKMNTFEYPINFEESIELISSFKKLLYFLVSTSNYQ